MLQSTMSNIINGFDIDPTYFPAVNADVIKKNPDLWKKFIHMDNLQIGCRCRRVLSRKQKLNVF